MMPSRDWFSDDEVSALFAAVRTPWWKAFLSLGVDVGLRPVEALNMLWEDIDPTTLSVRVQPRRSEELRLDDGAVVPVLAFSPSVSCSRTVPAPPYTINALRRLRRTCEWGSPYVFVPAERLCRLFPLLDSGRSATTTDLAPGIGRVFVSVQREARVELSKRFRRSLAETPWRQRTLAALRNTFAQRAAEAMRPADLAAHMGFARSTAVLAHYDRNFRDRRGEA